MSRAERKRLAWRSVAAPRWAPLGVRRAVLRPCASVLGVFEFDHD